MPECWKSDSPDTKETHPELLAHHYTEASLIDQAIPYWQNAGQQASQRSANAEAISHLHRALDLLHTLPDTPERAQQELTLQIAYGSASMAAKGYGVPEVEKAYARARELCQQLGETPQIFPVLVGLNRIYSARAELHIGREVGEQCVTLAQRTNDPSLLVEAHRALGNTFWDYAGVKKCNKNVGVMNNISTVITPAVATYLIGLLYRNTRTSCVSLALLCAQVSHDTLRRVPLSEGILVPTVSGNLWQGLVQMGGYLVIDDTSWERFTRVADAVSWVWSSSVGKPVWGMQVVLLLWTNGKWKVPVGMRIWRKGSPSKMELAIGLLRQARRPGAAARVCPV